MKRIAWTVLLVGCSDSALTKSSEDAAFDTGGFEESDADGTDADTDADDGGSETEDDYLRLAPAASDAYVFVANPTRDTVTRIGVPGLDVLTTSVGQTPTSVATTSDYTRAVTLDEGSDTISIIDAETLSVVSVPIRENFNTMSLSTDGRWAAAWFDPDHDSSGNSGGVQSFNEVSFVDLDNPAHTPMAVGFNPSSVRWS